MKYALLIYSSEAEEAKQSPKEREAIFGRYFAFTNMLREKGAHLGGEPLQSVDTATCLKVRDSERVITDGPFAETKEQLGGFYLVEASSLDEALEYAAQIPTAEHGTIEVRPLMDIPGA